MATLADGKGPTGANITSGPSEPDMKEVKVDMLAEAQTAQPGPTMEDWDSERKIASSLWALQQLDSKIYKLRDLVPERILGPLKPIITETPDSPRTPKSPQQLFEELSQAARDGVAEIDEFKSTWNGPEMKTIWDRADDKLNERGADYPYVNGVWERNYGIILKNLDREERLKEETKKREEKENEKERLASVGGTSIVESFKAKGMPGTTVQILPSTNGNVRFSVQVHNISTTLHIQKVQGLGTLDAETWHVGLDTPTPSTLGLEIVSCLMARDRKWDLPYLLDMISSYAYIDVKKSPCVKCNKLIDINGQLPAFRKPKVLDPAAAPAKFTWEPYHKSCA